MLTSSNVSITPTQMTSHPVNEPYRFLYSKRTYSVEWGRQLIPFLNPSTTYCYNPREFTKPHSHGSYAVAL
ncbi:hypothetical protein TNCV_904991 [Trichonephila clavipes]|nr:hypothetical protein TNCV_904991 [Trichonephila clavipes]